MVKMRSIHTTDVELSLLFASHVIFPSSIVRMSRLLFRQNKAKTSRWRLVVFASHFFQSYYNALRLILIVVCCNCKWLIASRILFIVFTFATVCCCCYSIYFFFSFSAAAAVAAPIFSRCTCNHRFCLFSIFVSSSVVFCYFFFLSFSFPTRSICVSISIGIFCTQQTETRVTWLRTKNS